MPAANHASNAVPPCLAMPLGISASRFAQSNLPQLPSHRAGMKARAIRSTPELRSAQLSDSLRSRCVQSSSDATLPRSSIYSLRHAAAHLQRGPRSHVFTFVATAIGWSGRTAYTDRSCHRFNLCVYFVPLYLQLFFDSLEARFSFNNVSLVFISLFEGNSKRRDTKQAGSAKPADQPPDSAE